MLVLTPGLMFSLPLMYFPMSAEILSPDGYIHLMPY